MLFSNDYMFIIDAKDDFQWSWKLGWTNIDIEIETGIELILKLKMKLKMKLELKMKLKLKLNLNLNLILNLNLNLNLNLISGGKGEERVMVTKWWKKERKERKLCHMLFFILISFSSVEAKMSKFFPLPFVKCFLTGGA